MLDYFKIKNKTAGFSTRSVDHYSGMGEKFQKLLFPSSDN